MAKAKVSKSATIREALTATPDKPAVEIAKEVGVSPALVYNVKAAMKKKYPNRCERSWNTTVFVGQSKFCSGL